MKTASFETLVKYNGGTYTTQTHQGHRASATSSAQGAAQSLGRKVYGDRFERATELPADKALFPSSSRWRITAKA